MKTISRLYLRFSNAITWLQSPLLLLIRLYWGWQFMTNGWGKLHNIEKITGFFSSLNIPFPAANAHFIATLECVGGALLILGLGTRLIALLLSCNMLVAYWTADHDALLGIISKPDDFIAAAPFSFLFASLVCLAFGAGAISLDALIAKRLGDRTRST